MNGRTSAPIRARWFRVPGRSVAHASLDGDRTLCGFVLSEHHPHGGAPVYGARRECRSCRKALNAGRGAWNVESSSRPGLFHVVENDPRTGWACSCEAGEHGLECRHVRSVREGLES